MKKQKVELPVALADALTLLKLPHAIVIAGPEKQGRDVARLLAKTLLCPHREGCTPCGTCGSCTSFEAESHPDFRLLRDEKSIKVDQVRDLKARSLLRPIGEGGCVFIVERADLMTPQSAKALLKLMEEPPAYLTLILQTALPDMLPDTLLSRTTVYQVEAEAQMQASLRKDAERFIDCLLEQSYYSLLAMQPKLSSDRAGFMRFCDALCAVCLERLSTGVAVEKATLFLNIPKTAMSYKERADGTTSMPLLAASFLIECKHHYS